MSAHVTEEESGEIVFSLSKRKRDEYETLVLLRYKPRAINFVRPSADTFLAGRHKE